MTRKWHLRSLAINEVVYAPDQYAALDSLRDRPAEDFGLIAEAEPDESGDPYPVRTTLLMHRWGRLRDAQRFAKLAKECGLPDTRKQDKAAGTSPRR